MKIPNQSQSPLVFFDCPCCGGPTEVEQTTLKTLWEKDPSGQWECPACHQSYILPDPVVQKPKESPKIKKEPATKLKAIIYEKEGKEECVVTIFKDRLWITNTKTGRKQLIKNECFSDIHLTGTWCPVTVDRQGRKLVDIPLTENARGDATGGLYCQWKEGWVTLSMYSDDIETLRRFTDRIICENNPDQLEARLKNKWAQVWAGIVGLLITFICGLIFALTEAEVPLLVSIPIILVIFAGISAGMEIVRLKRLTTIPTVA